MNRRRWLLSLAIGVILLGSLGYWGYHQYTVRKQLEIVLTNKYYRSFYDTLNNIQNVEVLLSKLLVAQAPEVDSKILLEIWQRANAAQTNLNQLPLPDISIGRTAKFLTQVGDYAYSLAGKVSSGVEKNPKERETLSRLYKQASTLNTDLQDMERQIAAGKLYLSELSQKTGRVFQRQESKLSSRNFQTVEEHMKGIPALIYDGPFSDHLEKKEPKGLTGGKITAEQAREKALEFLDRRHPPENYAVERVSINEGKIKAYQVDIASHRPGFQEWAAVAVSETGGHVLWYTSARNMGRQTLSLEQAREKAKEFLIRRGYRELIPTYYEHGGGVAIFNFAATQNGVILYPDQVKVSVALDDGQVVGLEAASYLMNHHRREIPRPRITAAQARTKLSPNLKNVTGGHLALIPAGVDKEKLVYEFRGQLDNDTFLVYINALDGKEEQVLRLVRNREGILTL